MDASDVQKRWQPMDWRVNWNIVVVQRQLYQHFRMFSLVMELDLEMVAAVVDSLVVKSIVVAHMFRMYRQFVHKPIVSVWLAAAVEYLKMMHVVRLKSKFKKKFSAKPKSKNTDSKLTRNFA